MASTRPHQLIAGKAGQTVSDGPLEIRSGSVFYESHRIASVDDLVDVIPREDITLIEVRDAPHMSIGKAALIGAIAGGVVGALVFAPRSAFGADNYTMFGVVVFAPIGAGVGLLAGLAAESNVREAHLIYEAP
jgi:hypothetical protein